MRVWGCQGWNAEEQSLDFGDGFDTFGLNWAIEMDSVLGPYIGIFVVFLIKNKMLLNKIPPFFVKHRKKKKTNESKYENI